MDSSCEILKISGQFLTNAHAKPAYKLVPAPNSARSQHRSLQAVDQYKQILHIDEDLFLSFNILIARLQILILKDQSTLASSNCTLLACQRTNIILCFDFKSYMQLSRAGLNGMNVVPVLTKRGSIQKGKWQASSTFHDRLLTKQCDIPLASHTIRRVLCNMHLMWMDWGCGCL